MKIKCLTTIMVALVSLAVFSNAEAIGGGGRGGGGGRSMSAARPASRPNVSNGRNYRPEQFSRPAYNSPSVSMSRADNRQNFAGRSDFSKPSEAQLQQFMEQGSRAAFQSRGVSQGDLQNYLQPGRSSPTLGAQNLQNLNRENARTAANAVSQFRGQHPNASNWFNRDFFDRHGNLPGYFSPYYNAWAASNWADTAAWLGLGSSAYGYPGYYYDSTGAYSTVQPEQTASTAAAYQNQSYASSRPPAYAQNTSSTAQGDWLPLGVFAVGKTAAQAPYSNQVMQLAVNKEGEISGTYYNASTDKTYPIQGMVDKNTQKVAWKVSNDPGSPVASTGLYNLTQDVINVKVYYYPELTEESKVLVRLSSS